MPKVKGVPNVRFTLFSTKDPNRETYVYLYFHYRGKRLRYITGEKVLPSAWDFNKQRAKATGKNPHYVDLNQRLNKLESLTIEIFRETNFGNIDPVAFGKVLDIRMGYAPIEEAEQVLPTLLEFIETAYQERKKQPNAKEGTLSVIRKVKNHLANYSAEKRVKLEFADITQKFFYDFKAWLFAPPRNLQTNYVHKIFSVLKMFMQDAKRRGYHSNEAFEAFKIKKEKTSKIALTFSELETLYELDLSNEPRLQRVRDLFLIGAYTGLRFSDFSRIQPEHLVYHDGKKMLEIVTQKTGEPVTIPVLPILESILESYQYRVPKISSQKMNAYLKELGQKVFADQKILVTNSAGGRRQEKTVEKWEKLSTHVARRSFATNFYEGGVKANSIMKITGHSTERAFREYICIDGKTSALDFAEEASKLL